MLQNGNKNDFAYLLDNKLPNAFLYICCFLRNPLVQLHQRAIPLILFILLLCQERHEQNTFTIYMPTW